ncbi:hypothetical protein [Actinoplanes sp. NPDC049316]|uniref:hypothetical protein n=1 Tax=Actinoplanes sp. NPDC049316 TaxID=3154727 RepID=UPI00344A928C
MANGRSGEADIDLGNMVFQIKEGKSKGVTGQIEATAASTGRRVIGYAPDMTDAAWRNAARQGIAIARTPDELVAMVGEMG